MNAAPVSTITRPTSASRAASAPVKGSGCGGTVVVVVGGSVVVVPSVLTVAGATTVVFADACDDGAFCADTVAVFR